MRASKTNTTMRQAIDDTLRAIEILFEVGDVIEIRALAVGRNSAHSGSTYSGYFSFENREAIAKAIERLDGEAEGIYVVLNRFNPALQARANNRLQAKPKHTTSDVDIIEWRWLYIDVDAVRPAGISATDEEHRAALERATEVRAFLDGHAWPAPISCDSSNGGHLLYLLPQLELQRASELVKRCLKALANRFSDARAKVDEATANPARICKLYGTLTRKGDEMPDRPHRRSKVLDVPEHIQPVPVTALEALAGEISPVQPRVGVRQKTASVSSEFDIDRWLEASGLEVVRGPEAYEGGRRWFLRECPFNPEHKKPVVIELSCGGLVYRCLHKSCSENDWKTLRSHLEPNYQRRTRQAAFPGSADGIPHITDLSQIPSVFSLEAQLDWCVKGMIAQGSITLICAESGTGKTWVGYFLAGCVAHGVPVLSRPVRACKVLYLDGENPLCVAKQRLLDLGISETPNLTVWGGWNLSPPVGPENPLVVEFARQHKGLIIYDSLIEFHPGSEQSSTETRAFMRHFRTLANFGAAVAILHHTGKAVTSKLYRGSSDIKAAVDTAYLLARNTQDPEELRELSMTCFKARLAPGQNFRMTFKKTQGFVPCESFKPTQNTGEIVAEILEARPNSNQTEIVRQAQALGCTKRQIEHCLKTGSWVKVPGPKNSTLYSLPTERSENDEAGL